MKQGYSRKINLQKYGGNTYESFDVWCESDVAGETFDDVKKKVDDFIIKIIKNIPNEQMKLLDAKSKQPPFVTMGEIEKKNGKN